MKKIILSLLVYLPCLIKGQDIEKLGQLYADGHFEKAIEAGKQLLIYNPNSVEINLVTGQSFCELGNYKEAIPYLQKATNDTIVQKFKPAWAKAYLGNCYFATGNFELAKKYYEESLALKATRNVVQYVQKRYASIPGSEIYKDWETVETKHFRFHFRKDQIQNPEEFINRREKAFLEINKFFCAELSRKIDYYIWNDRAEASQKL